MEFRLRKKLLFIFLMRTGLIIAAFIMTLQAPPASANNEPQPQENDLANDSIADISTADNVILEMKTSSGSLHSNMLNRQDGIRILKSGSVISFDSSDVSLSNQIKTTKIANLSPSAINKLNKLLDAIGEIPVGELVSESSGLGMCLNAPTTNYTFTDSNGKKITFSKKANCRNYYMNGDNNNLGKTLREILDTFKKFK
ncbi:MAG: hypothetical protein HQK53_03490 [Oligoflexia bacterium]|nr:hypothetical protein [Oligoflexia bacterium]